MTTLTLKRRTDGTIAIDHYRGFALMERRAAMTDSLRRVTSRVWPILTAAIVSLSRRGQRRR